MSDLPSTPAAQASHASPSVLSSSSNLRKERGAIAAQACDTCRSRKQRCDEQRPKCGTCQKFRLDCKYREPQPTKKDKTLVEILDRIKGIENKMDSLGDRVRFLSSSAVYGPLHPSTLATSPGILAPSLPISSFSHLHESSSAASVGEEHYKYVSSVHQMLAWPAIQQLLLAVQSKVPDLNLSVIERDGPVNMLGFNHGMAANNPLPSLPQGPSVGLHAPASMVVSGLNWDTMQRLSKAYFDGFNLFYPVLDRHSFLSETLPLVFSEGFDQSMASTIAFLVFSLGEVALAGSEGHPVHVHNGRPSGIRGGSKDQPPGLDLFNEARKRMGFNLTVNSLENIQMFALAGVYYATCFNAMFDTIVGLPDFSHPFSEVDYISNQESHCQEHFASQIVLRRLLVDFDGVLSQTTTLSSPSAGPGATPFSPTTGGNDMGWRGMLPAQLRWQEDSPGAFPNASPEMYGSSVYSPTIGSGGGSGGGTSLSSPAATSGESSAAAPPLMFTTDLDAPPVRYPYGLDVQVALLRSRYYYTKYLVHRPFVYKALHFPDAVTHDDAAGVAECLKASLKWPVAMSPTCTHKRLIPCIFFFTRNLFGILVLLHLSTTVPILRRIRTTLCGERFEMDAGETVGLYLDWLRDIKTVDPTAAWHWDVARVIYGLEE
ncbi:hypothetical protein B0H63DRAFT_516147 [Podospora didyma]|uniref:Zn(2)-C6 fungal-type domain-containing protein n=1 Tax=Podospora didyma TaxID=330526 RepID=A0AAE0U6Q3_9PEZI|nr:hypothetical protein B0H63DRAFT_516147 [Podospora didyma]